MALAIKKVCTKSTKALQKKKKKVYWSIRAGGAGIAESWGKGSHPANRTGS